MKDINILTLVCCVIFLLMYFKFIDINLDLSRHSVTLFNNPFFRLFSLLIINLIAHDCDFIFGALASIIYILILDQGIKANKIE